MMHVKLIRAVASCLGAFCSENYSQRTLIVLSRLIGQVQVIHLVGLQLFLSFRLFSAGSLSRTQGDVSVKLLWSKKRLTDIKWSRHFPQVTNVQ